MDFTPYACTGARFVVQFLESQGIDVISGIPGGANLPLYDALYESRIRHVLVRHEQAAGFLAQGMARSTGKPAVALATSGPGATNLITAVADAKLDSVPLVAITGQVSYRLVGTDAFQEVDTYGMTVPVTKHNFLVRKASELPFVLPEAFRIAMEGRPGPVLVDIPKDVLLQTLTVSEPLLPVVLQEPALSPEDVREVRRIAERIRQAARPVLYVGGGTVHAGADAEVRQLAERCDIPMAATLMALGVAPVGHPLFLGMLGMHGAPYTNYVMDEADLLVVLGARFDDRATGNLAAFCPRAEVVHLDVDPAEIHKLREAHMAVAGCLKPLLKALLEVLEPQRRPDWLAQVDKLRATSPFPWPGEAQPEHPLHHMKTLGEVLDDGDIVTTDVGQHQMWAAQGYPVSRVRTFLTSGGLGTMGFGLPAAMGAALSNPGRKVVCITGDGSVMMNIQELATLAELGLDVTVLVMNNRHLGMVRQQQSMFYEGHLVASRFESRSDFAAIAGAFGIAHTASVSGAEAAEAIRRAVAHPGPALVDIAVPDSADVLPIVPPGRGNTEMLGG